jgi:two-component system response regulator VicR
MKILVVDDDRELVELLSFALLRAELVPLPAYNSAQALEYLVHEQPALVLLDVHLEAESGLDLLCEMRNISDIPIIVISAATSYEQRVRAFELGADDYLTKPFGMRELLARIRARLRRGPSGWLKVIRRMRRRADGWLVRGRGPATAPTS